MYKLISKIVWFDKKNIKKIRIVVNGASLIHPF